MLRLECLGRLVVALDGHPRRGAAAQRRRLALLAVLAAAGDRGVSRDRLLALFWPEAADDDARHALKQAVYALRRDLAADDVITGVTDLRLNPAAIAVDVWEFEQAATTGRLEDAVSLYAGPFLDGIHIGESEEFDPWADGERARLESRFVTVLEQLAREHEGQGRVAAAVTAWRRLAARRPLDARVALATARAMAQGGDRGGALTYLREHEARIRDEFGIEADAAVAGAIVELRSARASGPTVAMPESTLRAEMPAEAAQASSAAPRASRIRRGRWAAVATLVVLMAAVVTGMVRGRAVTAATARGQRVAVLPFRYHGDTTWAYLGDGIMSVLSSTLDGVGALHAADPIAVLAANGSGAVDVRKLDATARRLDAAWTIAGDIVEAGGRLRVSATMRQHASGSRTQSASAEGRPQDFYQLVDQIAAELAAGLGLSGDGRLTRTAAATTTSYSALREFFQGETAMRSGRYAGAAEHYLTAVREDSNFAAAWYRLSVAADWAGLDSVLGAAVHHATRLADRLPMRDRTLIDGVAAWRHGDVAESERLVRTVTTAYPDDPAAWYNLGEVLFHGNQTLGRPIEGAREPFERVLALDTANVEAMRHLARIAAREGRRAEALGLLDRAIALTDSANRLEMQVFRAVVADGRRGLDSLRPQLVAAHPYQAYLAAYRTQTFARDYDVSDELFRLALSLGASRAERASAWGWRGNIAMGRGRLRLALSLADSAGTVITGEDLALRTQWLCLPFLTADTAQLGDLHRRLERRPAALVDSASQWWARYAPASRLFLESLIDMRRGALVEAERHITALDALDTPRRRTGAMSEVLRAAVAFEQEHWVDVLDGTGTRLQSALLRFDDRPPEYVSSLARYLHAMALVRLGRLDEAADWLGGMENMNQDMVFEGPVLLAQADLLERRGEAAASRVALRRFVALWNQADPEFQPLVADARRRLTARAGGR